MAMRWTLSLPLRLLLLLRILEVAHGAAFSNSSTHPTSTTPVCGRCTVQEPKAWTITWYSAVPTQIVAATVVVVVDRGANTTTTTTVFNNKTQLLQDNGAYEPASTNAEGTAVTTLTISDSMAHTQFTTVITYPSVFLTYDYSYAVEGTFQATATDGSKYCVTAPKHGTLLAFPSHPPFPKNFPAVTPKGGDNVGTNFLPEWDYEGPVDFFSDVGPMQTCDMYGALPYQQLTVASYLTETSTHYKVSETVVSSSQVSKEAAAVISSAPPETAVKALPAATTNPQPPSPPETSVPTDPASPANSHPPTTPAPAPTLPPLTIGTAIITPDSANHFTIGNQILTPGGLAITISGTPISAPTIPTASNLPLLTIGSQIITPYSATYFVIGAQTLIPGGPAITVSGTLISIPATPTIPTLPLLTIGNQIITPDSATHFAVGTQTLIPGGAAITISGTPVSIKPGATNAVVGTSTVGLGSWIVSGFDGLSPPSASGNESPYTGPISNDAEGFGEWRYVAMLTVICVCTLVHSLSWI